MVGDVLQALGGLGLFLLGMIVMTEGLRALAGDALGRVLLRFTRNPTSGALTGATLTALVQSSSATTVAAVGFVSAGLMTYSQALGVLFGANVGTTATGWLVVLLGFELELGRILLPALLVGALLRLLGPRKARDVGWALAGFALLFLGLEGMRTGMAGFGSAITPADFPPDTWSGRLVLVSIGVAVTLVTQSSSAGVATALAALGADAITFPQASAMVIGMDIGTTSTTALATIGGSTATRRAGYSHVVYNVMTGLGALLLLDPYTRAVEAWVPGGSADNAALALVGFHTTFNTLGVLLVLPFTHSFANLMLRLVPETAPPLTRQLEPALLGEPRAASRALVGAVREITAKIMSTIARALTDGDQPSVDRANLAAIERALGEARRFSAHIGAAPDDPATRRRQVAAMHCLDHLERLVQRCKQVERVETARREARLRELSETVREALRAPLPGPGEARPSRCEELLEGARDQLRAERHPYRDRTLEQVSAGRLTLDEALRRLEALRWLHRSTHHAWRIVRHLRRSTEPGPNHHGSPPPARHRQL